MIERLRVALLIESSRSFGRQLLKGIASYGRAQGPWTFFHEERAFGDLVPPRLKAWKPDGIIARLGNAKVTRQIRRLNLPTGRYVPRRSARRHPRHRVRSRFARSHGDRPLRGAGLQQFRLLRIQQGAVLRRAGRVFRQTAYETQLVGERFLVSGDAADGRLGRRRSPRHAACRQARRLAPRIAEAAGADDLQRHARPAGSGHLCGGGHPRARPGGGSWRRQRRRALRSVRSSPCRASIRTSNRSATTRLRCWTASFTAAT